MSQLTCPHCGKQAISGLRKMCMGPALPGKCRECGKKVGVPYSSMFSWVPLGGAIVIRHIIDAPIVSLLLIVGGLVLGCVMHMKWVPLEPR